MISLLTVLACLGCGKARRTARRTRETGPTVRGRRRSLGYGEGYFYNPSGGYTRGCPQGYLPEELQAGLSMVVQSFGFRTTCFFFWLLLVWKDEKGGPTKIRGRPKLLVPTRRIT